MLKKSVSKVLKMGISIVQFRVDKKLCDFHLNFRQQFQTTNI